MIVGMGGAWAVSPDLYQVEVPAYDHALMVCILCGCIVCDRLLDGLQDAFQAIAMSMIAEPPYHGVPLLMVVVWCQNILVHLGWPGVTP